MLTCFSPEIAFRQKVVICILPDHPSYRPVISSHGLNFDWNWSCKLLNFTWLFFEYKKRNWLVLSGWTFNFYCLFLFGVIDGCCCTYYIYSPPHSIYCLKTFFQTFHTHKFVTSIFVEIVLHVNVWFFSILLLLFLRISLRLGGPKISRPNKKIPTFFLENISFL